MIRNLTLALVTLLAACTASGRPPVATAPQSAAAAPQPATAAASAPVASTDPAAPEQKAPVCVAIHAANEREGLAAEGTWLHDHYPGWKKVGQSLNLGPDDKKFDQVEILDPAGVKHSVCFDITSFFGKW